MQFDLIDWIIWAVRPDMLDLFVQFVLIGWNYLCGSTWLAGIISLVRPDWLELFVQIPLDWREQLVLLPQLGWNYLCNVQILLIGWKYLFRSPLNGWNYMCRPPELAGIICATFVPLFCHFCATCPDLLELFVQFDLIGWYLLCSSSWLVGITCAVCPDFHLNYLCSST